MIHTKSFVYFLGLKSESKLKQDSLFEPNFAFDNK